MLTNDIKQLLESGDGKGALMKLAEEIEELQENKPSNFEDESLSSEVSNLSNKIYDINSEIDNIKDEIKELNK